MSRFLRIVIFTLLIAAIVFFGFRASQPVEKIPLADHPTIDTPAVKTQTEAITPPDLKDLSVDESDKKEKSVSETKKVLETQKKEVEIDTQSKEKDK